MSFVRAQPDRVQVNFLGTNASLNEWIWLGDHHRLRPFAPNTHIPVDLTFVGHRARYVHFMPRCSVLGLPPRPEDLPEIDYTHIVPPPSASAPTITVPASPATLRAHALPTAFTDLQVGQMLEVLDSEHKWYAASVLRVDEDRRLRIHYQGWDPRYDEWIPQNEYRRLRALTPLARFGPQGPPAGYEFARAPKVSFARGLGGFNVDSQTDSPRRAEEQEEENPIRPTEVKEGQVAEHKDHLGMWNTVRIKAVDGNRVLVHYLGWPHDWDEWVDLSADGHTFRPLSDQPPVGENGALSPLVRYSPHFAQNATCPFGPRSRTCSLSILRCAVPRSSLYHSTL